MEELKRGAHIHLMGICGTAMASLAGLLKEQGYQISGSDQNVYPPMSDVLRGLGISILNGYRAENLEPRPDLVIVGNVISRSNEEAKALLESNIAYTSLPKALERFVLNRTENIVVAGTHGKSTTTAMMAWVATQCGHRPGYMVGGVPKNLGRSFEIPHGRYFVIEGDEYDTAFFDKVPKFIYYRPKYLILGSIEFDHADIYKDLDAVLRAFEMAIERVPQDGVIVARHGDPNVASVLQKAVAPIVTFGWESGDYHARNWRPQSGEFDVMGRGAHLGRCKLNVIGRYNVLNSLAALALASELKWDWKEAVGAIESFQGVKRRQEIIGAYQGITIMEDFAHHPTAVELTIEALKERYPQSKILAIFEPRSATSRRNVFQNEYRRAFSKADFVLISKPFDQTKIAEGERFSSDRLVEELRTDGVSAWVTSSNEEILNLLRKHGRSGDVAAVMSNGGFDGLYKSLVG